MSRGVSEPIGEPRSPADAASGLPRCRKSDRRTGHVQRVSLAGAVTEL